LVYLTLTKTSQTWFLHLAGNKVINFAV